MTHRFEQYIEKNKTTTPLREMIVIYLTINKNYLLLNSLIISGLSTPT